MIDDTVTTCDCCGKTGLKSTVLVELDDGETTNYGSVCAVRNTGKPQKQIAAEIRSAHAARVTAATAAYRASPERAAYEAKLAARPLTYLGPEAYNFIRAEANEAQHLRAELAIAHGIDPWEIRT